MRIFPTYHGISSNKIFWHPKRQTLRPVQLTIYPFAWTALPQTLHLKYLILISPMKWSQTSIQPITLHCYRITAVMRSSKHIFFSGTNGAQLWLEAIVEPQNFCYRGLFFQRARQTLSSRITVQNSSSQACEKLWTYFKKDAKCYA